MNPLFLEVILRPFNLSESKKKELAATLSLPKNNQNQDLMFLSGVLVSTGTNRNGAHFMGSELIKARGTVAQKAVDIEHDPLRIIGHIVSCIYLDQQGNTLDDKALYKQLSENADVEAPKLDAMNMDIGIVCVIYKDRFPDLAQEIQDNQWKLSMECYYDDYDLKVGNTLIRKTHKSFAELDNKEGAVKLVADNQIVEKDQISRVLRNIKFCGVGVVKNPANDRSVILEAASKDIEIIMEREAASETEISIEGIETLVNQDHEVVQKPTIGYMLLKNMAEVVVDSFNLDYNEITKQAIKHSALDGQTYTIIATESHIKPKEGDLRDEAEVYVYKTNDEGTVKEIHSVGLKHENAHLLGYWGPKESTGLCVSFEKYVRQMPGRPNSGKIVKTHWCKQFNEPCPVVGADAHDMACLRNKYAHYVKDNNIFQDAIIPAPYNPRTTVPRDQLVMINDATDLPTSEETQPPIAPLSLDTNVTNVPGPKVAVEITPIPVNREAIPLDPLPEIDEMDPITDGYQAFPVKVKAMSFAARKSLSNSDFGLPKERKFPLHDEDHIMSTMQSFATLMLAVKDKKKLFNNLIEKATLAGVDTEDFEFDSLYNGFVFKEHSDEYALPRLKLLPLTTKEQVLAAMSRFAHLKVDLADEERKYAFINILRACQKFNIDASPFRQRIILP